MASMTKEEFNWILTGDRVRFVILSTGICGEGTVLEIRPWSDYPLLIQWFDYSGDKHIEQFNYDSFQEIYYA